MVKGHFAIFLGAAEEQIGGCFSWDQRSDTAPVAATPWFLFDDAYLTRPFTVLLKRIEFGEIMLVRRAVARVVQAPRRMRENALMRAPLSFILEEETQRE